MSDDNISDNANDNAGVKFPPPFIPLSFIGIGYALQRLKPMDLPGNEDWSIAGWGIVAAGIALLIWGQRQFVANKTNIRPDKPASTVICSGPYRFTRNPLYLAFLILQTGIGILMANLWIVLFVPLTMIAITLYVIPREEAYMERAFGDDYLALKATVRRWL